jgi:hypothetical protein
MKYILLLYGLETGEDESPESMEAWAAFDAEAEAAGVLAGGEALEPTAAARTLRVQSGEITDGPFAETKEQLGGYYVLDCADIDEGLRWAAKVPIDPRGFIEVRPILDLSALMDGAAG